MDNQPQGSIYLTLLPEHARMELLDFYEFLSAKYGISSKPAAAKSKKGRFSKFIESPIRLRKSVKYTREELHERR